MYVKGPKKKAISIQPVCLTDSDYDYVLEEIGRRDKIEFERDVEVYSADEEINMSILNEYYMYLLRIYILNIIRFFSFLFQRQFVVFEYEYICNLIL